LILSPDLRDIERTATSDAERRVARLLRAVEGDPDAVAFHSVKLRSHAYKQQAEADFVLLWRGVVVVVEVKGGGVRKYEGVWYSIDRRDEWHRLATSPMEQSRSAAYALRDILTEEGTGWYAHEAVVITPDIEPPPHSPEWSPSHWLSKDDMTADGLRAALDAVVAGARRSPSGRRLARTDDLRVRLFGEFTRIPVIDAVRGAVLDEQNRATGAQARVLATLARNPRVLVTGGAGTGKSVVLAEAAKQEADLGRSTLITFRSPGLSAFFSTRILGRDIDLIAFDDLPEERVYDSVFVDEAQDLMNAEAMDRLDRVVLGGRSAGRWRMFLDPNNQSHVDGEFDEDVLILVAGEATTVDLDLNVRNTKAIVHVVQEYLGADVGDPGIVHGEKVQWILSETDGPEDAEKLADQLVADGVGRDDIWIIDVRSAAPPARTDRGVIITNPRDAKGLEAEHVIVCGLPEVFDARGTAALYVAVTRARVALHVVASKPEMVRLKNLVRLRMVTK
jgi:hypothetical protein